MNLTGIIGGILLIFAGTRFEIGEIAYGFTGSQMFILTGCLTLLSVIIYKSIKFWNKGHVYNWVKKR